MVEGLIGDPGVGRLSQLIGRLLWIAIGVPMACIMVIAAVYEINANDFFGASVSLMVVVFGLQLTSIGIRGFSGRTRNRRDPDPLEKLWYSEERVYIIRPSHAKLDIRGRP